MKLCLAYGKCRDHGQNDVPGKLAYYERSLQFALLAEQDGHLTHKVSDHYKALIDMIKEQMSP